ncbi:hypothetical protein [Amycolatopsis sp. NPDC059021]|uniref:hypothetical protein n=1 Tax=Amycolatopsis sp. NPDC059021 TaxID=3346704 RepID=UPI00366D20A8
MPDWTYHPLRGFAAAVFGERRSQRAALRALATVGSLPGGGRLIARVLGHQAPAPRLAGSAAGVAVPVRLGALVPPAVARDAIRALAPLGAGFVVVSPVRPQDVGTVREAATGRRIPLLVHVPGPDAAAVAEALDVDAAVSDLHGFAVPDSPSITEAADALADPATPVLATPPLLVAAGPGWFARVVEAADIPAPSTPDPRRPSAWWWGLLVGLGMIGAGLGAAAITLGPVLLPYDRAFLGTGVDGLHAVNHHLVHFLQHDRITMAGTMLAIGVLYTGLAAGGMRRGAPAAREVYLVSGWVGFPTVFYLLGFGFLEPLHIAVTLVLLPLFLAATRRSHRPQWTVRPEGPERERRRALTGQLLLVLTGVGLALGGVVISVVGLTGVFVPSDLDFLHTTPDALTAARPRLLSFIAHDRAGFGGTLMSAGTGIASLSAWCWRRGESWVWWSTTSAAACGFLPAVAVHGSISYTDFLHLAPLYAGMVVTAVALVLARPYLCARPGACETVTFRRDAVIRRRTTSHSPRREWTS